MSNGKEDVANATMLLAMIMETEDGNAALHRLAGFGVDPNSAFRGLVILSRYLLLAYAAKVDDKPEVVLQVLSTAIQAQNVDNSDES